MAKILIFDSGVGGLSVLAEVRNKLPNAEYLFACDNAAFPYGIKSESLLVSRVEKVLGILINKYHPDLVVVACNSASTLVLPKIRSHFDLPIVGVVPAIKPAAAISQSKTFGLLATPGTVRRQYTQDLIEEFASNCRVQKVGSSDLVAMAEAKLRGLEINTELLQRICQPLFDQPELDTVVLACTHFPLLAEELQSIAPRPINWVDSGEAIARRVASLLGTLPEAESALGIAIVTRALEADDVLAESLASYQLSTIHTEDLPWPE